MTQFGYNPGAAPRSSPSIATAKDLFAPDGSNTDLHQKLYREMKDRLRELEDEYHLSQEKVSRKALITLMEREGMSHGLTAQQTADWVESGSNVDKVAASLSTTPSEVDSGIEILRDTAISWL